MNSYEIWLDNVRLFAEERLGWTKEALSDFPNWDGLRESFDEGLTPQEYWEKEYRAAQ